MHGILSLVKNLLCACPGQIPRYSGLEYQSYSFALLKKLSNTCPAMEGSQESVDAKHELNNSFIAPVNRNLSACCLGKSPAGHSANHSSNVF